ncbi:hypothetical protein N7540_012063 [Penicillium herquei]|nr:hypothetical protein N7540_012063 [Penicillium herquei]
MTRKKNKSAKKQRAYGNRNNSASKPVNLKHVNQPQSKVPQANSSIPKHLVWCGDCETNVPHSHACAATCARCNNRYKIKDAPRHDCTISPCCGCCQRDSTMSENQAAGAASRDKPIPAGPAPKQKAPKHRKRGNKKKACKYKPQRKFVEE